MHDTQTYKNHLIIQHEYSPRRLVREVEVSWDWQKWHPHDVTPVRDDAQPIQELTHESEQKMNVGRWQG